MTIKKIVAINEIAVEIIPRIFDLIHPLNPSVTRKKKKPERHRRRAFCGPF